MAGPLSAVAVRPLCAGIGLVLAVLAVHLWLADRLVQQAQRLAALHAMPERMQVAYVREMPFAAPPAPPAAAAVQRRPARQPPLVPAAAASAPVAEPLPEVPAAEQVASEPAPEPAAEPASAALAVAPADSASSAAAAEPFAWPVSTRMRYVLTGNFRGEVHGEAQVEWIRAGERYQVHLDIVVGMSFAPLGTRRMSSDGDITPEGLSPRRYDQETRLAFNDAYRAVVLFDGDRVILSNGSAVPRWPGVQDTASQFVQLSYLFSVQPERLYTGNVIEIPLALPRNLSRWVYDVLEEETVYTPFGAVQAFHLKPQREARAGGDLITELWVAPRLRYLPVRFRIRQDAESYFDLVLDHRPEMAAPDRP